MAKKNKPFIEVIQEKPNYKYIQPSMLIRSGYNRYLWHLLDNAVKFTNQGSIRYGCYENHQPYDFLCQ